MPKLFGLNLPGRLPDPEPDEDELDQELEIPEGDEPEGDPDPLDAYDDDARGEIEALIREREAQARAEIAEHLRQQAQSVGFDFNQDGSFLLADREKLRSKFGEQPPAPAPLPPPTPNPAAPPPIDLSRVPDPGLEPVEFQKWQEAWYEQKTAGERKKFEEQLQQQQYYTAQLHAANATTRAIGKLNEMGFANVAAHPEFVQRFQQTLMGLDMSFWQDDTNLARVALGLIPDLGPMQPQRKTPTRKTQPTEAVDVATSIASRAGAQGGFMPSRGMNAPAPDVGRDADYARVLGISVDEVRALKDQSGESYTSFKQKQKSRRR